MNFSYEIFHAIFAFIPLQTKFPYFIFSTPDIFIQVQIFIFRTIQYVSYPFYTIFQVLCIFQKEVQAVFYIFIFLLILHHSFSRTI